MGSRIAGPATAVDLSRADAPELRPEPPGARREGPGAARWWRTCEGSFTTAASALARTISIRFCSRARASRSPRTATCTTSAGCAMTCSSTSIRSSPGYRGHDRHRVGLRAGALPARGPVPSGRSRGGRARRRACAGDLARAARAARDRNPVAGEPRAHRRHVDARDALCLRLRVVSG